MYIGEMRPELTVFINFSCYSSFSTFSLDFLSKLQKNYSEITEKILYCGGPIWISLLLLKVFEIFFSFLRFLLLWNPAKKATFVFVSNVMWSQKKFH